MNNSAPRSSPSEYRGCRVPSILRKRNIINSPTLSPSDSDPLPEEERSSQRKELSALHRTILQAEKITIKFHEMREKIEEIIRKEEQNLTKHIDVDRETMNKLAGAFKTSKLSTEEDPEAQAFVETEISQIKRRMSLEITNLLTEDPRTNHSSHEDLQTQESGTQTHEELSDADAKVENDISQPMEEGCVSQESNCHELEETSIKTQDLHSDVISNPPNQIVNIPKGLSDADKPLLMFFAQKLDESTVILSPTFQYYPSSDCENLSTAGTSQGPGAEMVQLTSLQENRQTDGKKPDSLSDLVNAALDPEDNEDSVPEVLDEDDSPPYPSLINENEDFTAEDLRIVVDSYHVLASDPRFFKIDWKTHYTRYGNDGFECFECSSMKNTRIQIEDHIWTEHYGGGFHCHLCPNLRFFTTRHGVGAHMRFFHVDSFPTSW